MPLPGTHKYGETMKRHPLERIVSLPREGCYADDGSPIKCPECGHAEFTEKMRDFIGFGVGAGPATEIEYFCGACGESVAYWAYGSFDPAYLDHKQANAIAQGREHSERPAGAEG